MEIMNVHWQKCTDYPFWGWCQFNSDLLDDPRLEHRLNTPYGVLRANIVGVYIIWAGSDNRTILKVGSGRIKDRLRVHIRDPNVQAYKPQGLYVTWTSFLFVDEKQKGIETFLGILLNPKLTQRLPDVDPIWVNLPEWHPPGHPLLRAMSRRDHILPNRPPIPFRNR